MQDNNPDQPTPEELARRTAWFHQYVSRIENQPKDLPLRCPCCFHLTLDERGDYDICPVCFWEDDGQDDYDTAVIRGGPNGALSLEQARQNYIACGACETKHIKHVRPPKPEEIPG